MGAPESNVADTRFNLRQTVLDVPNTLFSWGVDGRNEIIKCWLTVCV